MSNGSRLSDRLLNLSESATLAMSRKSRELSEQGLDIINLSLGEPDFDTPEDIKDAAKAALDKNMTHYTPVPAYMDVRQAISRKLKRDNELDFAPSQIVVSTGAKQSIANIVLSLVNEGDEVILPAPYWVSYEEVVKLAGGIPVVIPSEVEDDFKISAEQLASSITGKTKLIIYSSPCNPSGSVYTKEELKGLAQVIANHKDITIISDEIYEYINYVGKHESIAQFEEVRDQVVIVNGVSKGYAMTGWRVGYIAAPQWIADAAIKIQGQITSATCSIAQLATKWAVEKDPADLSYMLDAFKSRKKIVIERLSQIDGIICNEPKGAFYLFPDFSAFFGKKYKDHVIQSASDLSMYFLTEAHVATVGGDAFGQPKCIRISFATSEENLIKAIDRMAQALNNLTD